MTLKVVDAWNIWQSPLVEVADSRNKKIEMLFLFRPTLEVPCFQSPLRSFWLPIGPCDLGLQPDFRVYVVLSSHVLPVVAYLGALCVFFAPLGVRRECGLVDMGRDIASDSWVNVLVPVAALVIALLASTITLPCSSQISILFQDSQFDAWNFSRQQRACDDSRKAGTNDNYLCNGQLTLTTWV